MAVIAQEKLERVLYVEDDPTLREIVTLALQQLGGWRVRACADSREALEAAVQLRPQLLLSDLELSGIDGVETWKLLRRVPGSHQLPAIFLTGHSPLDEAKRCLQAGAWSVIAKPFDPIALPQRLAAVWRARHRAG